MDDSHKRSHVETGNTRHKLAEKKTCEIESTHEESPVRRSLGFQESLSPAQKVIEGFGGKRVLGFLLKSELCQSRSKFRMQLCLGVFNNVLHVFCLKFASFLRYYVCKKHIIFQGHPLGTYC